MDVIGDFLTILRNGIMRSKPFACVPFSRLKYEIALLLKQEGFIRDAVVESEGSRKIIKVFFKYVGGESVIHELVRISTPGSRMYAGASRLGSIAGGFGIAIVSTNKGVMTNKSAREQGIGGEILCTVW